MKLGLNNVSNLIVGSDNVSKIYLGTDKLYDRAPSFTQMIDAATDRPISQFFAGASVTEQFNGYSNYPFLRFNSANNTLDTYFETPIAVSTFDPNNWSMEIVFRPRSSSSSTSWTMGTTIAGFGTSVPAERITCDMYYNEIAMREGNGSSNGGWFGSGPLNLNDWYYLKTYEAGATWFTYVFLQNLTTGASVVNTTASYTYYNTAPNKIIMGGNPVYSAKRHLDVDIAMVRIRSEASQGIPTETFVMPTAADKDSSDAFFMIGA